MVDLNNIRARVAILETKLAGVKDIYRDSTLLAEIKLLIRDVSILLQKNRAKPKTKQLLAENDELVKYREKFQKQLR